VIYARPMGPFVVADCWLAAENLMLAAHALGLGSCVIGSAVGALNAPEVKLELGIPADSTAVAPVIVGTPKGEWPATTRKPPQILGWRWQPYAVPGRIGFRPLRRAASVSVAPSAASSTIARVLRSERNPQREHMPAPRRVSDVAGPRYQPSSIRVAARIVERVEISRSCAIQLGERSRVVARDLGTLMGLDQARE
jgi:hypothetical protein